jgi:histidine triad (HIT) family protein
MKEDCPFCQRVAARQYDTTMSVPGLLAVFEPLQPVTPGHLLVVPFRHVEDAAAGPVEAGQAMEYAARLIAEVGVQANIITSVGPLATQTIRHLHLHIVPRWPDDGLVLPWGGQQPLERM